MQDNKHLVEEEVEWTDSQIRWEEDGTPPRRNEKHEDDDEEEDEALGSDLFAPDPRKTFSFEFSRPVKNKNSYHEHKKSSLPPTISITLQGYAYESDQTWSSTGMTLWRASEYLCHYLVRHWDTLLPPSNNNIDNNHQSQGRQRRRHVLELGAGLGLCGLVAHHLAAGDDDNVAQDDESSSLTSTTSVYVTDGDKDVLVKLRENVALNQTNKPMDGASSSSKISCHQLLWGHDTANKFLHNVVADQQKFHLIVAADVVYVKSVVQPLWETVQTLLDTDDEHAKFILAFARRRVDVTVDDVLWAAQEAGFVYERKSSEEDLENGLFLYTFRWKR